MPGVHSKPSNRFFVLKAALGLTLLAFAGNGAAHGQGEKPLLLRKPAVSQTQIVFSLSTTSGAPC